MKDIMSEQEWKESGITCLAARPAMGKTALAIELVLDAVRWMEKKVVWFSLEMSKECLTYRLEDRVGVGSKELQNIMIDDTPGISLDEVKRKLQDFQDVGMVVIDYLQLMSGKPRGADWNRKEEVRQVMQGLSRISEERQIPMLVLSQLTGQIDRREDKRPCLEDMHRDIQSQNADQVIFLYREAYYREIEYREEPWDDSAEIILAKSRFGNEKTIHARFDDERCYFWKEG